ncbi:MAG: CAP domain-containing protein [Prevotella sp.]|nr:CAP domain-containing protein [Prevotella sp.]
MKRTLKRTIAAVGAAAVLIGTAVPASAANCGKTVKTYCPSYSNSCGNYSCSDIGGLLKNYSSCFDILKKYGITVPGFSENQNGNNNANSAQRPGSGNCSGGSCTQTPDSSACPDGSCTQTPDNEACPGGNCTAQIPDSDNCPNGSCTAQTPVKPGASTNTNTNTNTSSSVSDYEKKVAELVNEIRKENGLSELTLNTELSAVARAKSRDMKNNNYFSHTSPTYGSPFDMMKTFGISYRTAGENIAMGYSTPEAVVSAWMNSEGHRANILNSSFKEIGMGYVASGNYWTQMFIG